MRRALVLALSLGCKQPEAPATGLPSLAPYAYLADTDLAVHDTLEQRFPPPPGFTRVQVDAGSFGAFLRTLPLAAPTTPVRTYTGKTLHEPTHPNVAAVAALDIGKADLQQCADSVIRLHAEWQWSLGNRAQHYKTAAGRELAFAKFVGARPSTRAAFRAWLDQVFRSANTASLANEAAPVDVRDVRPGDFLVVKGAPFGHAVLILDLATSADGRKLALLGQGFMPAQSFHVLRRSPKEVWFAIDESSGGLETPFWKTFPWSALRRLRT